MNFSNLLIDLETLLTRHSHLGIDADLPSLTPLELCGLYCFLMRLEILRES